jgi:hypothetical protein
MSMANASSRALACLLFFIAAMGAYAAEPAPRPNPVVDYHFAWLQVTSAIGEISRATLVLDADKPDPKAVQALTDATDRLEEATTTLLRAVPPAENTRLHVTALPRVIEIVGACGGALLSRGQGQCRDRDQPQARYRCCSCRRPCGQQPSQIEKPAPGEDNRHSCHQCFQAIRISMALWEQFCSPRCRRERWRMIHRQI